MSEWKILQNLQDGIVAMKGDGQFVLVQQTAVAGDGSQHTFQITALDKDGGHHILNTNKGASWNRVFPA